MTKLLKCDICEVGELKPSVEQYPVSYKGRTDLVQRHSHVCTHCLGDYALAADARENKREVIRFQKLVDSIPLGCEIRAMRERSNLTQVEAGNVFGGGPTAFSKYESDDLIPADSMVNLLKLAIFNPDIVTQLRRLKGVHVAIAVMGELAEPSGDFEPDRSWEIFEKYAEFETLSSEALPLTYGSFKAEQKWNQ